MAIHKRGATPVFINCPFDDDYAPFFEAAIFAITRCGFAPRSGLEVVDTSESRLLKIVRMIRECPMGIHDISRTELDAQNQLPRFNMPLELGLFLGAKFYGDPTQNIKACLVLDREAHRYQKFMSDIAGQDISSHEDDLGLFIKQIRNFLNTHNGRIPLPSGETILQEYNEFKARLPEICKELKLTPSKLQFADFTYIVADYMSEGQMPD